MKNILRAAIAVFGIVLCSRVSAQLPGCPAIEIAGAASGVYTIPCGQTCTTLSATAFSGAQTTSYRVDSIAYAPPFAFNAGTPILVQTDDEWSNVINLPFNFCFFGNTYNRIVVGSNGVISFNPNNANGTNSWRIPGTIPNPSTTDMVNTIMGPWQDMDPTFAGSIAYQIGGTYPCRYFEVSWYKCPMFGDASSVNADYCTVTAQQTQMIVMYETTNAIDIYIQEKDQPCDDAGLGYWNGGLAIEGIQNASGTVAYSVPGRNATQWAASNDAWRFTPNGAPNYTINWYHGATLLGSGSTVTVCPPDTATYTAIATYTNCDQSTITVSSDLFVRIGALTARIDSVHQISCNGGNDGAVFASFTPNTGILNYGWIPGGSGQTFLTGLSAGTYIFQVADTNQCFRSDTVTLIDPTPVTALVADTTVVSCTQATTAGSLTAIPGGGTPGYTYLWSYQNSTSQTISGIGGGNYTVTVTDSHQCTASASGNVGVTVNVPTFNAPQITNTTCFGGTNGQIIVSLNDTYLPPTYNWSGGLSTSDTLSNVGAGSYTVTATDALGCTVSASYAVTQPTQIQIDSAVVTPVGCTTPGSIHVYASGGTGPLTYNWYNASTADSVINLIVGTYALTVTDSNGCSITASFNVGVAPGAIQFVAPIISPVRCNGDANGSITAVTIGGTGPISYIWDYQNTAGPTITGLSAGTYTITATDTVGCSATASYTLTNPPLLTIDSATIINVSCNGGSNGSITVHTSGGTAPITFTWTGSSSVAATASGLAVGSYDVTATDSMGCSATATYNITEPAPIVFDSAVTTDAQCQVGGSILIYAHGGTGTLTYTWSNGQSGNPITGVAGGPIVTTITDANGCTLIHADSIPVAPGVVYFGTPIIVNLTCNGGNTGSITAVAQGGTGSIGYLWSYNNATTATISGLAAGSYSVTITDSVGCSASTTYTVTQPNAIVFGNPVITNITCNGGNNGCIVISATGGTGSITFAWDNTVSGATNCGLAAGTYSVTATDSLGCTATASYTVSQPNPIVFNNPIFTNVSCNGQSDGAITASATGGNGVITYHWDYNNATTATITGLAAGTYNVTATDTAGCSASTSYTLNEPLPVVIDSVNIIPASCASGGSIQVYASGGTGNLSYNWTGGLTGSLITGLQGGIYTVTVADQNNCSVRSNYTVGTSGNAVSFGTPTIVNLTCNGANNGSITAVGQGGTGTIHYHWSYNNATTATISGLSAGSYSITITDSVGCSASTSYTITQPAAILVDSAVSTQATCQAGGSITIYAHGGTGVLHYHWNYNNDSTSAITGVAAGTYGLTITDDNGCSFTGAYTVGAAPGTITFNPPVIVDPRCYGDSTGSISISTTGGTGTISYQWNYNNAITATLSNLPAGSYSVTASDNTGCSASITYQVNPAPLFVASINATSLLCFQATNGTATVTAIGGTPGYRYNWFPAGSTQTITDLAAGTVSVTVTDANSCTVSATASIAQTAQIWYTSILDLHLCQTNSYGNVSVFIRGGVGPLTLTIPGFPPVVAPQPTPPGDSAIAIINNIPSGTYTFTVTDSIGCSSTGTLTIPQSQTDQFIITSDSASCFSANDGSIIIVPVDPSHGPYTYSLNGGAAQTDTLFTGLSGGSYTITTHNTYGCTTTETATVASPAQGYINLVDTINTFAGVDNPLTNTVGGFTNPVFTWTPSTGLNCDTCPIPVANVDVPSVYYVTVYDSANKNCAVVDSVVILIKGSFGMPDAFTPNGDGKDDDFGPITHGYNTIKAFRIYNRWGQMVHNSTERWDGKFKGEEQPVGTYIYYIQVEYPDPENPANTKTDKKEGSVVLLH